MGRGVTSPGRGVGGAGTWSCAVQKLTSWVWEQASVSSSVEWGKWQLSLGVRGGE